MRFKTFSSRLCNFPRNSISRRSSLVAAMALSCVLAGCSTNLKEYTGSLGAQPTASSSTTGLQTLAARYDARPGDKRASLDYAAALRTNGQYPQAVAVLERTSVKNVGDREVAAAYGKALADVGRFQEAMAVLSQAHTADRPDWQVLSSMGAISDQMGNHERAREFYANALQIAPQQPMVLNNLGLSYILTKDIAKAETTLAQAAAQPGADPRIRANLALARSLRSSASKKSGKG